MPKEREHPTAGGPRARALDTISETAGGIPDDAIGPEQRSVPEQLDLAEGENAEAMAAKLRAEVDERRRKGPRLRTH